MHLITSPLRRPGTTQGAACQPLGAALPARIGLSSCRRPPPGRPRSPAPAAPPAGAGRGAGGQSRPALGLLRPGDPCAGARPRVASWGPAGRLQPREAGERPPGLGRVAASVPPLGVAGEETSLPAEPRAPGFAWDVRGEGGGWMVVGRSLPLWRAPVPKRVPAARCGGVGREVALPPLNANADSRRGF